MGNPSDNPNVYHSTHDRADSACEEVRKGLQNKSGDELLGMLNSLRSAQGMSDGEDDNDLMFAPTYHEEIGQVEEEIRRRLNSK